MKKRIFALLMTTALVVAMNVSVFADALTDWQASQARIVSITQQIQANTAVNPQFAATPAGQQLQAALATEQQKSQTLLPQALAIANGQKAGATAPATQTAQPAPVSAKGYIRLADGTNVTPGGRLTLAQLQSAVFVNNTGSTMWYAGIASPGAYSVVGDDPDWAYEGQVGAGQTIALGSYMGMFSMYPTYNCLTMELAASTSSNPIELSFFVR